MSTTVNTLREITLYIRALTFDNDQEIDLRRNNDASIKRYIMAALVISDISATFSPQTELFSNELSESEKVQIALEASIIILGGVPEDYSYKNPVMSGRMKFETAKHIQKLEDMLNLIKNGSVVASSYDEVRKILASSELLSELTQ